MKIRFFQNIAHAYTYTVYPHSVICSSKFVMACTNYRLIDILSTAHDVCHIKTANGINVSHPMFEIPKLQNKKEYQTQLPKSNLSLRMLKVMQLQI